MTRPTVPPVPNDKLQQAARLAREGQPTYLVWDETEQVYLVRIKRPGQPGQFIVSYVESDGSRRNADGVRFDWRKEERRIDRSRDPFLVPGKSPVKE